MAETDGRVKMLALVMRVLGVAFVVLILTMFDLWPAGFRWVHPHPHPPYERMLQAIYVSLGICLFRTARDPLGNVGLIDFTILSSLLHAAVMAYDSVAQENELTHLVGDVPILIAVAVVLVVLHPRRIAPARGEAAEAAGTA